MNKWMVLNSRYINDNRPFHRSRQDHVKLPNGAEFDYDVEEYPDWINALVLTPDQQVVLVYQYRHGIGDFFLEIPGGMTEPGEDPTDGIIREVAEETGYRSPYHPIFLGQFYPNPATNNNRVKSYLLLDAIPKDVQHLDPNEDLEVRVMPLEEYGRLIHSGSAPQMFSAFVYYLARHYLSASLDKNESTTPP